MVIFKIKSQIKSPYFNVILKISKSSQNDLKSDFVKSSIKSLNTLTVLVYMYVTCLHVPLISLFSTHKHVVHEASQNLGGIGFWPKKGTPQPFVQGLIEQVIAPLKQWFQGPIGPVFGTFSNFLQNGKRSLTKSAKRHKWVVSELFERFPDSQVQNELKNYYFISFCTIKYICLVQNGFAEDFLKLYILSPPPP
jgi:hypothetical protein